jgi:hypothetical protein
MSVAVLTISCPLGGAVVFYCFDEPGIQVHQAIHNCRFKIACPRRLLLRRGSDWRGILDSLVRN